MYEIEEIIYKDDIQEYLADCVQVVRGKEPKNLEKLYNRLLTESIGDMPSRVFEYIPIVIPYSKINKQVLAKTDTEYTQVFGAFKYVEGVQHLYTNARYLLSIGVPMGEIEPYINFKDYKVFRCTTPYFIYGQVSTHTQLTTVSHSQRYSKSNLGYWKPKEISYTQDVWNEIVVTSSKENLVEIMKNLGVVRKEVYDRGTDMLQYRSFTIGGYTNVPTAWKHFIAQRTDSHTQKETQILATQLNELIYGKE